METGFVTSAASAQDPVGRGTPEVRNIAAPRISADAVTTGIQIIDSGSAEPVSYKFWLSGGVGLSTFGSMYRGGISLKYNRNVFSARISRLKQIGTSPDRDYMFGLIKKYVPDLDVIRVFGLMFGRWLSDDVPAHLSGGIGLIRILDAEEGSRYTLGIPVEFQFWHGAQGSTEFIGLGLTGVANLNPELIYAGLTLDVTFGALE